MKQQYSISQEEFELIEQFLTNEMPPEEAVAFKARLLSDELWQQKTEEVKLTILGIKEVKFQDRLSQYHTLLHNDNPATKKQGRVVALNKKWLAAASILLLVSLSVWWLTGRENKFSTLYATYYKPDPGLITAMGSSEDYAFEKGMVDYKEGNYKKAIEVWLAIKPTPSKKDTLIYFLGVANMAIDKRAKAKEWLSQITSNNTSPFYKDACWYLGLVFLKEEEKEQAIEWIKKSAHPKSNDLIHAINKE